MLTGGIVKALAPLESRILDHAADFALVGPLADARIAFVPGYKNQTLRGGAALVLYEQARGAHSSPGAATAAAASSTSRVAAVSSQEA